MKPALGRFQDGRQCVAKIGAGPIFDLFGRQMRKRYRSRENK
jgi:hypothetical protein